MTVNTPLIGTPGQATGSLPMTETYRHLRDGQVIVGATALDYTTVLADESTEHILEGTMTNSAGSAVAYSERQLIGIPVSLPNLTLQSIVANKPIFVFDDTFIKVGGARYFFQSGDVFVLQRSTREDFALATQWSYEVQPAEVEPRAFNIATGAWPVDTSFYVRMLLKRLGKIVARSNVLTLVI
jgi:hypothetical protein